jgi:hypothetical protein
MTDEWDPVRGVPRTNLDQRCAFCRAARPLFVHPLDAATMTWRYLGKGYTWPGCVTACADCETAISTGDDPRLLDQLEIDRPRDEAAVALRAFRDSDQGPLPLRDVPPRKR